MESPAPKPSCVWCLTISALVTLLVASCSGAPARNGEEDDGERGWKDDTDDIQITTRNFRGNSMSTNVILALAILIPILVVLIIMLIMTLCHRKGNGCCSCCATQAVPHPNQPRQPASTAQVCPPVRTNFVLTPCGGLTASIIVSDQWSPAYDRPPDYDSVCGDGVIKATGNVKSSPHNNPPPQYDGKALRF